MTRGHCAKPIKNVPHVFLKKGFSCEKAKIALSVVTITLPSKNTLLSLLQLFLFPHQNPKIESISIFSSRLQKIQTRNAARFQLQHRKKSQECL
mmetsp:Transcript_1596/g.5503  ORF Transcript_1596/g.5503 Transcript_1596/m.5503 type:complete len:94 (+) Transcript_1596:796-1077(+)